MDKKEFWQEQLSQSRAALEALLNQLAPEQWQTPVFSEEQSWTVQDVVAHLVENERAMSIHIHKIRKGEETVPASFDLQQWNAGLKTRTGAVSPAELRQRMIEVRAKTLQGLATITEADWQLTGRHPARGVITIEQYFETIAGHETSHTTDIKTALGLA